MVRSRRRTIAHSAYFSPLQRDSIQFMQIVKVIFAVSSTEHINFIVIAVCRVHVARAWGQSLHLEIQPLEMLKVQDVQVVSS